MARPAESILLRCAFQDDKAPRSSSLRSGGAVLRPPLPYDETILLVDLDDLQLVEPLRGIGRLELLERRGHASGRNDALARPRGVAPERSLQRRPKVKPTTRNPAALAGSMCSARRAFSTFVL